MPRMRRRRFVRGAVAAAAAWTLDRSAMARVVAQAAACAEPVAEGELLGLVPLTGDRPRPTPFGEAVGGPGLDTRVFTDLSQVGPERLITPTAEVFVRTASPPQVSGSEPGPGASRWRAAARLRECPSTSCARRRARWAPT